MLSLWWLLLVWPTTVDVAVGDGDAIINFTIGAILSDESHDALFRQAISVRVLGGLLHRREWPSRLASMDLNFSRFTRSSFLLDAWASVGQKFLGFFPPFFLFGSLLMLFWTMIAGLDWFMACFMCLIISPITFSMVDMVFFVFLVNRGRSGKRDLLSA